MAHDVRTEFILPNNSGKIEFSNEWVYINVDQDAITTELDFEALKSAVNEHNQKLEERSRYRKFTDWLESIRRKS